jgi:hypothetical protein
MSIYFIRTSSGVTYELDSTTEIGYSLKGKATDNPVESGESVSDNYVNKPRLITLKGTISDIKSATLSQSTVTKTTEDFLRGLEQVKLNKELFSVHIGNKVGVITDCVFESLVFTQNRVRGSFANIDAFEVSMTIKQIRLASRALLKPLRDPTISDDASEKATGAGASESAKGEKKDLFDTGVGLIKGAFADVEDEEES